MAFVKISEQPSHYNDLEKKSTGEILHYINEEDKKSCPLSRKSTAAD